MQLQVGSGGAQTVHCVDSTRLLCLVTVVPVRYSPIFAVQFRKNSGKIRLQTGL